MKEESALNQSVVRLSTRGTVTPAFPRLTKDRAGWIKYGADNMFPTNLIDIITKSAVNGAIIESKVTYICGNGVRGSANDVDRIIGTPNPSDTWNDFIEKVATDYVTLGGFAWQVIMSKDKTVAHLFAQDFTQVRVGELDPTSQQPITYRIASDWRKTTGRNKPLTLKAWCGVQRAEAGEAYLYYYADYRPDLKYYPVPSYYNALEYIKADGELGVFYNNSISNGFTPSVIISMPTNPEEDKKAQFQKDMEAAFSGSKGASSIVVLYGETSDVKPTITPFVASNNADIYNNVEDIVFQKIITAHRLTSPTLAGVSGAGSLSGNAGEIIDSFILFNYTVIEKLRRKILDHINIFTALNNLGKLEIEDVEVVKKIRESEAAAPSYELTKVKK